MDQTTPHEAVLWPDFENDFWPAYDKKTGKAAAIKEWGKLKQKDREAAMQGVEAYIASTPNKKFRLDPERFLKRKKWEDEIIDTSNSKPAPVFNQQQFADALARKLARQG